MLELTRKPTKVAREVFLFAMDSAGDFASACYADTWRECFPNAAKCFTRELGAQTYRVLLEKWGEPGLFRLTDYHWLLLDEAIEQMFSWMNDKTEPEFVTEALSNAQGTDFQWIALDPSGHAVADCESLFLDIYFDDADYLLPAEVLDRMNVGTKKGFGFRSTTWAVAHSLPPHPEELSLAVVPKS